MSQKPISPSSGTPVISPLRQRMIEDTTLRNFGSETQRNYIRTVKVLDEFLGRSPATATPEDLRRFQVHQSTAGAQPPTINHTVTALRFFFRVTVDRPDMGRHLTLVRQEQKLPVVLTQEEVVRLLEAAPGVKYKAALGAAYGAGLRVSEVVALKFADIDSQRMLIRVEQGKGCKDRLAMLSPKLLELLRDWYRIARPRIFFFPGQDKIGPMTPRQLNRICHLAADLAGLPKWVAPHTRHAEGVLRHGATHSRRTCWSARSISV